MVFEPRTTGQQPGMPSNALSLLVQSLKCCLYILVLCFWCSTTNGLIMLKISTKLGPNCCCFSKQSNFQLCSEKKFPPNLKKFATMSFSKFWYHTHFIWSKGRPKLFKNVSSSLVQRVLIVFEHLGPTKTTITFFYIFHITEYYYVHKGTLEPCPWWGSQHRH